MSTQFNTQKQEIFDYVFRMLGGGMIDVELDPDHYETAIKDAFDRYRQRSDHSVEESYLFMPTVIDQNTYTLPNEVMEVRKIFRRSIGSRTGGGDGGTLFEPFNLAYTNTYLLRAVQQVDLQPTMLLQVIKNLLENCLEVSSNFIMIMQLKN